MTMGYQLTVAATMVEALIGNMKGLMKEERSGRGNFESELTKLKNCVEKLKSVSPKMKVDAEWIRRLMGNLYELEDLMDDLNYSSMRREQDLKIGYSAFLEKVRLFFSNRNRYGLEGKAYYKVTNVLKRINDMLQDLGEDEVTKSNLGGGILSTTTTVRSKHFDDLNFVIGRDSDKESIIEMLCGSHSQDASINPTPTPTPSPNIVVSIVGMGGVGKTTLARLVYHDDRVSHEFQVKMWATVSAEFHIGSILSQFLLSATGVDPGNATVPELVRLLHSAIHGNKSLIVLDDVWTERYEDWNVLRDLLNTAAPNGSKCLVTTRSIPAARSVGSGPVYDLQGLSETDSWLLFERVAFGPGKATRDERLVDIGKTIVSRCGGLPLALKSSGSLLQGHGFSKWFQYKNAHFANTSQDDGIMHILKLSFHHLPSALKTCFVYCSLFPKGHRIEKKSLIQLWIAQGYICPAKDGTYEDTAEAYLTDLVHRSFLQPIETDSLGRIMFCKMHDLLHDLAMSVAQGEIFMATPSSSTFSDRIRHLSVIGLKDGTFPSTCLSGLKNIRTYLDFSLPTNIQHRITSSSFLQNTKRLRVLDVHNLNISRLPDTSGQLLHLRYLDLSGNSQLEMLPCSITRLYNLLTLKLSGCLNLKELPCDFGKLLKLRHLDIHGCNKVSHMPPGFSFLTCLHTLSMFAVGRQSYTSVADQLEVLKSLSNLKGGLTIKLQIGSQFDAIKTRDAGYLKNMIHLEDLHMQWVSSETLHHETRNDHEALLEGFKPHCCLRSLKVVGFPGVTLPSSAASSANLVNICLDDCPSLHHLPRFSQLSHLKGLVLHKLGNLEYMESDCYLSSDPRSRIAESPTFFPSLENLTLSYLPKLKGWWSVVGKGQEVEPYHHLEDGSFDRLSLLSFPRLGQLKIMECPKLVSIPSCPQVEELNMYRFNDALQLILSTNSKQQQHSLRTRVTVDNVEYINHLPLEFHQVISYISIHLCDLETLSPRKEVFTGSMCSLQSLQVTLCNRLKSLSGLGWKHLTSLQRLQLSNLPVLDLTAKSGYVEEDVMPWKSLQSLQFLELDFLPKLVDLPEEFQYLTALKTLEIRSCHNLKALPEWISCLANLQSLRLEACTALTYLPDSMVHLSLENLEVLRCSQCLRERCQRPMGEDWPKIMHIPHISNL